MCVIELINLNVGYGDVNQRLIDLVTVNAHTTCLLYILNIQVCVIV